MLSCRICFGPESEADPFGKDLCLCCGINKIHVGCLLQWLRTQNCDERMGGRVLHYNWKQIRCELCRSPYPKKVPLGDSLVDLFQPQYDFERQFITLDHYSAEDYSFQGQFVVFLEPGKDANFVIGRKPGADIRLDCASVSKQHTRLFFIDSQLIVVDMKSKYGTLLRAGPSLGLYSKPLVLMLSKYLVLIHPTKSR